MDDLLTSVHSVQTRLRSPEDQKDAAFLNHLFRNVRFQNALNVHNKVVEVAMRSQHARAVCDNSQDLCRDILSMLPPPLTGSTYLEELRRILQHPSTQVELC